MQLNHHDTTPTPIPPPKICGNCGGDAQSILHNVRHRGIFRRLCTSCVLRLHPHSFCPTCFAVYQSPQPNGAVTCVKCYSSTHSSCVGGSAQSRYVCPLCANPNTPVFAFKKANELNLSGVVGYEGNDRVVDKRGAKVLVAAAMISSLSMSEAEVAARAVAERRAKEAASTRKRATQALDYMAALATREKMKKNEALAGLGRGGSMSRYGGNVGSGLIERRDGYAYNRVGNGGSDVLGGVRIEEKKPVVGVVVDGTLNEMVTQSLNTANFRENGGLGGVRPQGSGILELSSSDGVATDVDELRGISLGSGLELRDLAVQDLDGGVNPAKVQGEDALPESVINSVVLHPPKVDYMEGVEGSNPGMQGGESIDPGKNENGVSIDVIDELRGISSGSGLEIRDSGIQDHDSGDLNERSGYSAKIQDEEALRESVNSSVPLNPPKEDWMEGVENSTFGKQDVESADPGKNENGVATNVLERRGILSGTGSEVRDSAVQDRNGGVLNDMSVDSANIQDEDALRKSVNSVVSNPPKEDWMEGVESSNPGMQAVECTGPGKNENGHRQ